MANSSISIDVSAANSKLAQYLRKREEEESILQIGKKKVRDQAKQSNAKAPRGTHAKWRLEPDFSFPTPMVDRPRTTTGSTSFHFSFITITKQGGPTLRGNPIIGFGPASASPGLDHSKYIERDGAAERSAGAEHAAYVERPGAVETVDVDQSIAEGIARTYADVINETPMESEAAMLGMEEDVEGIPSIFSNISTNQFEREEYWRAVHRIEREPKMHDIVLDPEANPKWWSAIETAPDMHEKFREHCLQVREKHRQWLVRQQSQPSGTPFIADPWNRTAEECGRAIDGARRVPGWSDIDTPITFKSGPGGKVQIRFVAELPHEISAEDRALIVQNFCDHLSSFSKDENGRPQGMMYTAVIHAPDAHNDRRNYHLHIVAHDRPARFLEEHGLWDFEVQETYKDPGSGKLRVRYPFRQNKIGEVERKLSTKPDENGKVKAHAFYNNDIAGVDFIPAMRSKFAQITNQVLAKRGIDRRYDPRRYEEMGIDRTPTEHLGTRAAALEAIGVPTIVGKLNAAAIWTDAEKAIERRATAVDRTLKDGQKEFRQLSEDVHEADPRDASLPLLRSLLAERELLIENVAQDRRLIMTFDHLEAKAKSRAVRTRQTCLQFLTEIDKGTADHSTRSARKYIRERWKEAQNWIEAIDKDLAPDRPMLAKAADDITAREERIKEIDNQLAPLRATLAAKVEAALPDRERRRRVRARQKLEADYQAQQKQKAEEAVRSATKTASSDPLSDPTAVPAALDPIGMNGLPIVAPTIDPKAAPITQEAPSDEPVGPAVELSPLRPQPAPSDRIDPTDTATADIGPAEEAAGLPPTTTSQADDVAQGPERREVASQNEGDDDGPAAAPAGTSEPTVTADAPAASPTSAPSSQPQQPDKPIAKDDASEPPQARSVQIQSDTVDGRRREVDPVLFPLESGVAPVKPGTTKAAYADWDALVNRISKDRIAIFRGVTTDGETHFDLPTLDPQDRDLLFAPRFLSRTTSRLNAIYDAQKREIDRLVRWIQKNGKDPDQLLIQGRSARIGKAPDSVRTLFRNWRSHPSVLGAIRSENTRRIDASKVAEARAAQDGQIAQKPPVPVKDEAARKAERVAEAERLYPLPAAAQTRQVAAFIQLLREDAPKAKIQEAAEAVRADVVSREDVQRLGIELAKAYNTILDDDALHIARERDRRRGR